MNTEIALVAADSRELARINNYSIEAHRNSGGVVWLKKNELEACEGPYNIKTVMKYLPALMEEENICAYASIVLYLIYGWYRLPFVDLSSIEKIRNESESCPYDVSLLTLPRIEEEKIIFFARGFFIGPAIYQIIGPYPYCDDGSNRFICTILPQLKRDPEIEPMEQKISRQRVALNSKCFLL
jgi:hypothetical protein